jgi:HAD superfamily hydrolase (TIGR01509 family)
MAARIRKKLSDFDTIIFDWDGTLNKLSILYMLNRVANPVMLYRKYSSFTSPKTDKLDHKKLDFYMHGKRFRKSEDRFLVSIIDFLHKFSKPKASDGAVETLTKLHNLGKYIAVFTDGNFERVIKEARVLGLLKYIDLIISAQSLGRLKPDPAGIEAIIRISKSKPEACLMVGDMYDDILAAKRAGISVCAVGGGFSSMNYLRNKAPDFLLDGVSDMPGLMFHTKR